MACLRSAFAPFALALAAHLKLSLLSSAGAGRRAGVTGGIFPGGRGRQTKKAADPMTPNRRG